MKFTIEVNVNPSTVLDPNLPVEIIREHLVYELQRMIQRDASDFGSDICEMWIDITDDGDGKYNVYLIDSVE